MKAKVLLFFLSLLISSQQGNIDLTDQGHLANQTVHHMQLLADKMAKVQQIKVISSATSILIIFMK